MKKLFLALVLSLLPSVAWAQNPTCPDRPNGDKSNACANTRFVINNGGGGGANPIGPAGGSLSGTYPNPGLASQGADTYIGNTTGPAFPASQSFPNCHGGSNAATYTPGVGWGCNSITTALPSIANGHLLANGTGGTTTAGDTAPSTWFDQAFCNTVGQLITRISGTWVCNTGSPVNVTWFGVAGGNSGSANSTAIAAAQSACSACTYYFPAGSYKINSTIVLGNQQWLRCEGSASTEIDMVSANTNVVLIGGSNTNTAHQRVTGCLFTASASQSSTQAIATQNAHNIFIDHVIICGGSCGNFGTNNFANGIYLGGHSGSGGDGFFQFVSDFYMVGVSGVGIIVGGSGGGAPAGVYIHHGTIYNATSAGIFVQQTGGLEITSIEATLCGDGLLIAPTTGQSALYMFITDSFFDTSTDDGIKVAPTGSGVVEFLSVVNSWASTSSNTGIGIIGGGSTTVYGMRFEGDTIFNNAKGGFYQNGGARTILNGNHVDCNNTASSGTDGINFNSTSTVIVTNNIVASNGLGCVGESHAINFQASNNYTIIVGNNTAGNASINLAGAGGNTTSGNNL